MAPTSPEAPSTTPVNATPEAAPVSAPVTPEAPATDSSVASQVIAESAAASEPSVDSVKEASEHAQDLMELQKRQRVQGLLASLEELATHGDAPTERINVIRDQINQLQ